MIEKNSRFELLRDIVLIFNLQYFDEKEFGAFDEVFIAGVFFGDVLEGGWESEHFEIAMLVLWQVKKFAALFLNHLHILNDLAIFTFVSPLDPKILIVFGLIRILHQILHFRA